MINSDSRSAVRGGGLHRPLQAEQPPRAGCCIAFNARTQTGKEEANTRQHEAGETTNSSGTCAVAGLLLL